MRRIFLAMMLMTTFMAPVFSGSAFAQSGKGTIENLPLETKPKGKVSDAADRMTLEKMAKIVKALDANAVVQGAAMQLKVAGVSITIVADTKANRMRAFSAFKTLDGIDGQQLYRMMQANFDAALDARYAVAKGHVISVFLHPFAELGKDQFIEGVGQVVNLVKTFGTAYTSGAMTFGGGDSGSLHRELIDELLKKGKEI